MSVVPDIQMVIEYQTILSTILIPFEQGIIIGHLNSEQLKVCYSDVSIIQMFAIQIPTVFRSPCSNLKWSAEHLI